MEKTYFEDAHNIVRIVLQKRINRAAQTSLSNDILCVAAGLRSASLVDQLFLNENDVERIQSIFHHSARFNHLDLLSIGDDHVFIVHRQLLLEDIHDYLSGSTTGLQRVFVNVDYHLTQPEIMPMNRYKALEDYIRDVLLPEVEARVQSWEEAEQIHNKLAVPSRLSLVTLSGWLLSYPINYVLPGHGRRYSSGTCGSAGCSPKEERNTYRFPPLPSERWLSSTEQQQLSVDPDEEEDEEQDNGRNVLANQALVVTRVQLEPNERVDGLQEHCLLSFSYPAELAERLQDKTSPPPSSPLTPTVNALHISSSHDENGPGSSSVPTFRLPSALSSATSLHSNMSSASLSSLASATTTSNSMPRTKMEEETMAAVMEDQQLSPRLPSSESFDRNRPLPFSNPDISAAGRAFLTTLHARFQKQSLWTTWQVGQQTVTLPVVAM